MEFSVFQPGRRSIVGDQRCSFLHHAAGSFRRQPTLHVCGNAKLCYFSYGFESLQSGRQLFGLCQSLGCPGSLIVTIETVAHQFCHFIVLTVAPSGRCAPSRTVQCSNPERAEAICWTSMRDWHWGQRGRSATRGDKLDVCGAGNRLPPVKSGGSTTELSVTDGCRNGAVIAAVCRLGIVTR
jgi:hypothetical protein